MYSELDFISHQQHCQQLEVYKLITIPIEKNKLNTKYFIPLQKTLGVPCAEKYPLNLMQLVLPKGKVEQP